MPFDGRSVVSRTLFMGAVGLLVFMASFALAGEPAGRLASSSGGAVHVLAVGIDNYTHVRKLRGAVNDAKDIYLAVKEGGVQDRTLLLDGEATRENFLRALEGLHANAVTGDLVVLTFAGHGMKLPERTPNSKEDHFDELIVFANFDPGGLGSDDRIFGYEIFEHLKRFHLAGVQVLYLADSCFGGGMTKGTDARAGSLSIRGFEAVFRPELAADGKLYVRSEGAIAERSNTAFNKTTATAELPSLTFIAAVSSAVEAPEIDLGPSHGGYRGLASYALARALEGAAANRGMASAVTTRGSLAHFIRATVRTHSGGRQTPVVAPDHNGALEEVVFRTGLQKNASVERNENQLPPDICVGVKTARGVEMLGVGSESRTAHCQRKIAALGANLIWDENTGDVIDDEGVLIAAHVEKSDLPAIKLRSQILRNTVSASIGKQVQSWLTPKETDFAPGERFEAHFSGLSGYWLTIINLTGKGTIQYLYPDPEVDSYSTDSEKILSLRAKPPFGTDTLIVFATRERPSLLIEILNPTNANPALERLRDAFRLLGEDDKIGFAFFLTLPPKKQ